MTVECAVQKELRRVKGALAKLIECDLSDFEWEEDSGGERPQNRSIDHEGQGLIQNGVTLTVSGEAVGDGSEGGGEGVKMQMANTRDQLQAQLLDQEQGEGQGSQQVAVQEAMNRKKGGEGGLEAVRKKLEAALKGFNIPQDVAAKAIAKALEEISQLPGYEARYEYGDMAQAATVALDDVLKEAILKAFQEGKVVQYGFNDASMKEKEGSMRGQEKVNVQGQSQEQGQVQEQTQVLAHSQGQGGPQPQVHTQEHDQGQEQSALVESQGEAGQAGGGIGSGSGSGEGDWEAKLKEYEAKLQEQQAKIEELSRQLKIKETQELVQAKLAESKLPEPVCKRILEETRDKILSAKEVDAIIKREREFLRALQESLPKVRVTENLAEDEVDEKEREHWASRVKRIVESWGSPTAVLSSGKEEAGAVGEVGKVGEVGAKGQ